MTVFWMLAALLVVVAMLFVIPPLLRKPRSSGIQGDALNVQVIRDQLSELRADLESGRLDESAYAAARSDLERELLDDVEAGETESPGEAGKGRWLAILLVVLVPAMAVGLYQQIGTGGAVQAIEAAESGAPSISGKHSLEAMVTLLAEKMQKDPGNVEGWTLLGRSYVAMNRFNDAADAYRHALQLSANDPEVLSSYADVLVAVNNGAFTDEVGRLLDKALAVDPHHPKSLWLRGHWRFRHNDYAGAIEDWKAVMLALPPGDENLATIEQQIRTAQSRLGQPLDEIVPAAAQPDKTGSKKVAAGGSVRVRVSLDPALKDKASPDDTLFIYARAVQGPRMPLAIVRKRVADLPVDVTLDDSMAMSPAMVLSKFGQVMVGARISKSGQAMPASGDLQGSVSPVSTDGAEVAITINEEVTPAGPKPVGAPAAAAPGDSIKVHVALAPTLAARASPDDTVFIFARAVQGPRMPLAIVRKRVADLPVDVTLDDSLAMSPAMVLSKFGEVTVGARVSKSGQAMPSSGDLQGSVSPVKTDGAEVTVNIDQLVP
jgi:cytochrome c-type biogenesis protein CcmH